MLKSCLIVACVLWASLASAATRYVATTGSNANSCAASQTIGTPKQTLTGASGAFQCMSAGDTLLVRGGDYAESIYDGDSDYAPPSGTAGAYTRVAAYPGETVTLKPVWNTGYFVESTKASVWLGYAITQYVEFDGIGSDLRAVPSGAAFDINNVSMWCYPGGPGANFITWKNSELWAARPRAAKNFGLFAQTHDSDCPGGPLIQNNVMHGGSQDQDLMGSDRISGYSIYVTFNNTVIEDNEIIDARGHSLVLSSAGGTCCWSGLIVRRNIIRNVTRGQSPSGDGGGPQAIVVGERYTGTRIYNNLLYDNGNSDTANSIAIYVWDDSTNAEILNNTVYGNQGTGIYIKNTSTGTIARNNISYLNSSSNFFNAGVGTTVSNNLFGTDPAFVNAGTRDFHLTASSFGAIDTGLCQGAVPTDYDGVARPQGAGCDIGAFEYFPAGSLPGVPTAISPVSGSTVPLGTIALTFTSSAATSFDYYLSPYVGIGPASFTELFDTGPASSSDISAFFQPYTIGFTNAQKFNNRVWHTSTTVESAERAVGSFASDQWARVRLTTFGTGYVSAALFLRLQSTPQPSGYFIGVVKASPGNPTIRTWAYRYDNGAYVYLGSETATAWAANDFVEAHAVGNVISIYRNGSTTAALSVIDPAAAYPSGGVGLYLFGSTIGQVEIDNFEAGNIGPVFQGTFITASFSVVDQIPGQTYYWKPAGRNAQGVTEGVINTFTISGTAATPVGVRLRCIHGTPSCP